jgi:hypothetical protein
MTIKVDGTNGVLQAYDYQVLTTGFSYTFAAGVQVLLAVPAGTLATGTVTMPSTPADGMNITITSTQEITALTVNANTGQSIVGGGAVSLAANGSRTFVYRLANTTWYAQMGAPAVDIQTFNAGDADLTWDKPTGGQTMVMIQVWAGGGGGGRGSVTNASAGGGGGAYSTLTLPISYLDTTAAITVGAAGVGRTGSTGAGTAGGNSSVPFTTAFNGKTTVIAYGGGGGGGTTTNSEAGGGGGGGTQSAGGSGTTTAGTAGRGDGIAGTNDGQGFSGVVFGGGGGAGVGGGAGTVFGQARDSIWGGGGGCNSSASGAGNSTFAGNGGDGAAGTTPAGGGGSSNTANTNGFNGGAGRVIITSW